MNLKGCYSHKSDDWKTPLDLYWAFMNQGFIDCFKYESTYNEFEREYNNEHLFINPPYSKLEEVVNWIKKQYMNNCFICLLIPSRTDTKYFHELLKLNPFIYFIKGRLHFNESSDSAPFPSVILVLWKHKIDKYNGYDYGDISKFIKTYLDRREVVRYNT